MDLDSTTILVFALVIVAVVYLFVVSFIRRTKGSLRIEIPEKVYQLGEFLTGTIVLESKKSLLIKSLKLEFYGISQSPHHTHEIGPQIDEIVWRRVGEVSTIIKENFTVHKNETSTYSFQIQIPQFEASIFDKLLRHQVYWQLGARADIDGIDITTFPKEVTINSEKRGDFL